jgi:hypothetical protein
VIFIRAAHIGQTPALARTALFSAPAPAKSENAENLAERLIWNCLCGEWKPHL